MAKKPHKPRKARRRKPKVRFVPAVIRGEELTVEVRPGETNAQAVHRHTRQLQREAIINSCRNGAYRQEAAEAAGVARPTLYLWFKQEPEFLAAVAEAEAQCVAMVRHANYANALKPAGHQDRLHFLKTRGKDVERIELSGPDGGPIETSEAPVETMTEKQLERYAAILEQHARKQAKPD